MQPQLRELACLIALIGLRIPCAAAADGELANALPAVPTGAVSGDTGQDFSGVRQAVALNIATKMTPECLAAWQRSIESAPELLALADWPLDNVSLKECDERAASRSLQATGQSSQENELDFLANPIAETVQIFVVALAADTFDSAAGVLIATSAEETNTNESDSPDANVPAALASVNGQAEILTVATVFPVAFDVNLPGAEALPALGGETLAASDGPMAQSSRQSERAELNAAAEVAEDVAHPLEALLAEAGDGQVADEIVAMAYPVVLDGNPDAAHDPHALGARVFATSDRPQDPSPELSKHAAIGADPGVPGGEALSPEGRPIAMEGASRAAIATVVVEDVPAAPEVDSQVANESASSSAETVAMHDELHAQPAERVPESVLWARTEADAQVEEEGQPSGGMPVAEEGADQERAPLLGQAVAAAAPQLHDRAAGETVPPREVLPASEQRDSGQVRTLRAGVQPRPLPGTLKRDEEVANPLGGALVALDDSQLDGMRAGFEMDGGLKVSLGIERAVLINGQLVTTTSLNIKDLQNLSGGQAAQLESLASGTIGLVQNGAGNTASVVGTPGTIGTVVQNTLNNQSINNVTVINATVNSMQMLRSLDVQSAVRDGVINSLRR